MTRPQKEATEGKSSEFTDSMRKGLLLGGALLLVALPPAVSFLPPHKLPAQKAPAPVAAVSPQPAAKPAPRLADRPAARFAQFGSEKPSKDVRQMANWVISAGDHHNKSFFIVDKKNAKVYMFDPSGHLKASTPALLGAAEGDDSAPGIGDKPLSQVLPEEKTTPAGRFIAELGMNTKGEDIVWVDYDAAVSMHRVRANVKAERRLQRLASATPEDNRISFGCINLPPQFYEKTLKPTVQGGGAVIYVLPETRPLRETFQTFYEVAAPLKVAGR